jgi:hypothetical protein
VTLTLFAGRERVRGGWRSSFARSGSPGGCRRNHLCHPGLLPVRVLAIAGVSAIASTLPRAFDC